jgi:hypothetical protein
MPMSDDEQRKLEELEAELGGQRRLASLARHLGSANVDKGLRRVVVLLIAGGGSGLIMVIAGAAVHSGATLIAAVIVLAATMILSGIASIAVEVSGLRKQ